MLITLLALAIGMTAFAQYGPGRYSHHYGSSHGGYRPGPGYGYFQDGAFELGITLNHFTTAEKNGYKPFRPDRVGFFGEYRVDVSPIVDMGLQLSTTFGKGSLIYDPVNPYGDDMWYWQGAPLVVTDINLLPYSGFNPYFGLGIGPGFGYEKNTVRNDGEWTHALVLSPRLGVELFECLRMSVQYQWYLSGAFTYSHASFGISWAFGPGGMGRGMRPRR
jgi:hypothetical protein